MTIEVPVRRPPRKKGRVIQGMFFVWMISIFAVPAIILLTSREGRSDRLFGAWIMVAIQVVFLSILILAAGELREEEDDPRGAGRWLADAKRQHGTGEVGIAVAPGDVRRVDDHRAVL